MTFIAGLQDAFASLSRFDELHVDTAALPDSMHGLSDDSIRELLRTSAAVTRALGTFQAILAGIAAERSSRERGHAGFAGATGHRTPAHLIQEITGATKGESIRAVRVGEALLDRTRGRADGEDAVPAPEPWHHPLGDALLAGALSTAQHSAILHGLGTPPAIEGRDAETIAAVWRTAARRLAGEASECTVEELGQRARTLRDMLYPASAEERFAARFAKRSYRSSVDTDGLHHAHITFDPEMAAWVRGFMDAAISPRRGGPRFVADGEKAAAGALLNDPRTNEQLAYDLFADVFRAGALASAEDVYGTKEAGVRLVAMRDAVTGDTAVRDAFGRLVTTAYTEDAGIALSGSVLERALCITGAVEVTIDTRGNPLDVGREQRLYTAKQRLTLAVRDGGCMWPGCDRPPSYCESHHCDHWAEGGRTDCTVGILLCRYHHLHLHNCGWRVTRDGEGPFFLHAPAAMGAEPVELRSKSPLRWLWDPPPDRVGWRTAA